MKKKDPRGRKPIEPGAVSDVLAVRLPPGIRGRLRQYAVATGSAPSTALRELAEASLTAWEESSPELPAIAQGGRADG